MKKQSLMWFVGPFIVAVFSACAVPSTGVGSTPTINESVPGTAVTEAIATPESADISSDLTQPPPTSDLEQIALPLPPAGLVYRTADGLWRIDANGQPSLTCPHYLVHFLC